MEKKYIKLFIYKAVLFFVLVVLVEYFRRFRLEMDNFLGKTQSILTGEFIRIFFIALAIYAVFFFLLRRKRK